MDFPPSSAVPLGRITRPSDTVWVLELRNGRDNRFTGEMCRMVVSPALDVVEKEWRQERSKAMAVGTNGAGAGALVITGPQDQSKFFSNGFDFQEVISTPGIGFIHNNFVPILKRLLTFPIPTVAVLNGHTYAAGFMFALACDYRLMTSGKAWASMNEIHFGAPWPNSFAMVLQAKVRDPTALRAIALEGRKLTPQELLTLGLVDGLVDGDTKHLVERGIELGKKWAPNAATGVWGLIKKDLYRTTISSIQEDIRQVMPQEEDDLFKARL